MPTEPHRHWETDRLRIHPAGLADAQEAFDAYTSDPDVPKYMTWTPHRELAETQAFLRRCEENWERGLACTWTLRCKADDAFAGVLEARIRAHSVDIGYVLSRRYWRQGLMSEAVSGLVGWLMADSDIFRVWAVCDVENIASARMLEKVGMQLEGTLRRWLVHPNMSRSPRDCLCYSIVK